MIKVTKVLSGDFLKSHNIKVTDSAGEILPVTSLEIKCNMDGSPLLLELCQFEFDMEFDEEESETMVIGNRKV